MGMQQAFVVEYKRRVSDHATLSVRHAELSVLSYGTVVATAFLYCTR
jgi:hypothetical protein